MDLSDFSSILNESTPVVVKLYLVYVFWSNAAALSDQSYLFLLLFPEGI